MIIGLLHNHTTMKKIAKLYGFLVLLFIVFGCQQEADINPPDPQPTTVAQDKEFLNTTVTNTLNCIRNVRDGQTVQALVRFMALSNGTVGNEAWIETMLDELDLKMGSIELHPDNHRFSFSQYWGTYNWDRTNNVFVKTPATGIFINFPSEPTQTANNVNIKFATYTDNLYQANAENIYLPTTVKMNMLKDNVEIVNVDYTGNFSSGNFPSPISIVLNLKISPQNYKITVTRLTNVEFKTTIELFGSDCNAIIDTKTVFLNDDYNNLDIEEDLSKIEATYTKGNFIVKCNWDARAYYLFPNPTTNDINSTFNCSVYKATVKIGDLRFKDVNGDRKLYIYYKDNSSEDVAVYTDRFLNDLREILRPYFGNDVDNWF
jgi:hypothetical protein